MIYCEPEVGIKLWLLASGYTQFSCLVFFFFMCGVEQRSVLFPGKAWIIQQESSSGFASILYSVTSAEKYSIIFIHSERETLTSEKKKR